MQDFATRPHRSSRDGAASPARTRADHPMASREAEKAEPGRGAVADRAVAILNAVAFVSLAAALAALLLL